VPQFAPSHTNFIGVSAGQRVTLSALPCHPKG
jgi:hypothetical protein